MQVFLLSAKPLEYIRIWLICVWDMADLCVGYGWGGTASSTDRGASPRATRSQADAGGRIA